MVLRLRTIIPYTLPGVLALVGCWWFFSRKKDERKNKHKPIIAPTEVQADDAMKELVPIDEIQSSRAKPVQLDREASASQNFTCSVPSAAQVTSLYKTLSDCKVEDGLKSESHTQNVQLDSLKGSSHQDIAEKMCLRIQAEDDFVLKSPTLQNSKEETNQNDFEEFSVDVSTVCITSTDSPCDTVQNVLQDFLQGSADQEFADKMYLTVQTKDGDVSTPSTLCNSNVDSNQIVDYDFELLSKDVDIVCTTSAELPCNTVQNVPLDALQGSTHQEIAIKISHTVQAEDGDVCTPSMLNHSEETNQIVDYDFALFSKDVNTVCTTCTESPCNTFSVLEPAAKSLIQTRILPAADELPNSCMKSSYTEMLTGSVLDCLEEGSPKVFFGNYDAKIVEQLAINIISKVIVAAKQEIMSGSASEMADGSCQVLDEEREDILQKDAQSQQFALDKNDADTDGPSGNFAEMDSTCESTQTENSQVEDLGNAGITDDDSCLEQQSEEEQNIPNKSVHETQAQPNFSPVHKSVVFFEESQAAMEDSSISVCTSEDGISMEEPLQSTVLSSVGVGSYDSLSSSGIELSRENVNVSSETPKKVGAVESKSEQYSNGDVKRSSLDMKNEGPWTGDTEADHSGGSDVNSMDSVDSGCALGKSEQVQNVKQKNEAKKAEFVIWEFEVPKHLVGRLIGKQGRFVSFLKESSGAKIYISTLPYTQDYQICHIEGSQQQVDRALSLIGKKFKELNLTNVYAPPPSLALHALPMTSWLMLPDGVTVEVIVVNVVNAGHMFVQQHTHPTFHALCGLDQQMFLCYSQPEVPTLPTPVEVGVICAAPTGDNAWWRAQVVAYYKDSEEVEIRYVDYGGYERVKVDILRQIRSDFVTLPFQGAEVLLDNVIPLTDEDHFSAEADVAANEMTRGTALLAQVTNYDAATGLPLVQLWSMMADEVVSINRTLVERGFAQWIDSY